MYRANERPVLAVVFELTRPISLTGFIRRRAVLILCKHDRLRTVLVTSYGIIVRGLTEIALNLHGYCDEH
jgi:hypothetical protein